MSLRNIVQRLPLLARNHQCNRHFVRFKKRTMSPEVMEKYLDPELNHGASSKVTLVSQQEDDHIYITRYSGLGFGLNNNIRLSGPSVFFPRNVLKWKIFRPADINEKSLGLFSLITPKLDLLIIGTGSKRQELSKDTIKFLRQNQLNFEVMATDKAIAAFNFQNNDQRWIAAALVPPEDANTDLLRFVESVYDDILDSTDMIYTEEKELPKIESTDKDKVAKRLEDPNAGDDKTKQLSQSAQEDTKVETVDDDKDIEVKFVKSPLGQSLDFLSGDSVEKLVKRTDVETKNKQKIDKTTNKETDSKENKIEDKETK